MSLGTRRENSTSKPGLGTVAASPKNAKAPSMAARPRPSMASDVFVEAATVPSPLQCGFIGTTLKPSVYANYVGAVFRNSLTSLFSNFPSASARSSIRDTGPPSAIE